jgi:hypothetical protein
MAITVCVAPSSLVSLFLFFSTIMNKGHYSKKSRRLGEGWHPHFFEPAVLDRFRDDPNYEVSDTRVSTRDGAKVRLSGVQQYVWGRKASGEPCIVVLLPHLSDLSGRDQVHWHSFELPPVEASGARIEQRYKAPMLYGAFPDTISYYEAVFFYLREIEKVFSPEKLLPNLPANQPSFLAPLPFNSRKAMASFAQDLRSLVDMKLTVLADRLTLPQNQANAKTLLKHQRSRDLIRLYFEDHHHYSDAIGDVLKLLQELNGWRVESAHKLVPVEQDQDYVAIQARLMEGLQRGVRAMLIGFIQAENKTPDWTCERILEYKVS